MLFDSWRCKAHWLRKNPAKEIQTTWDLDSLYTHCALKNVYSPSKEPHFGIKCIYICVVWQLLTASTEEKSRKNIPKTWDPNSFYRRFSNIWKGTHSDARFAFNAGSSLVEKRAVSTRNSLSLVIQVWVRFFFLIYRLSGTPGVSQIPSEAFLPPLAARAAVTLTHSSFSKLVKREEKTNIHTFLHIHVNI